MEFIIKQKIDLIAECICVRVHKQRKECFGLYSEEFGMLLFLLHYSRFSKNEKYILLTEYYTDKLLGLFANGTNLHTFSSGFSGILYLFEFLYENKFLDIDTSDIQPLLDNYLVSKMRQDIRQQNYDFMHGALGVGFCFLKRKTKYEYVQELVDFLYCTAEKDCNNRIFKWKSIVDIETNIIGYNFSLSHGISSIIIFLSRVIHSGMINEKILEMLSGAVNYILSQQLDFSHFGSYYPNYLLTNSLEPALKSRLAWCYGDLGIAMALWQAGKALEKTEWKEKGFEILLQSTQRRSYESSYVVDHGICHGSSGIAMIFRKMYIETNRNEFKDAISYWLSQTLNLANFEDGLAGYKTFTRGGWVCDYSLLTGISGIGLMLISYLENDQQTWDELFLMS